MTYAWQRLPDQITLGVHWLQAVAPLQLAVAPPATTGCQRLHRSSQRCNRPQLCLFKPTLGPAVKPTPTHSHFLLYSSKSPPFPFHSSKPSKYFPFRSKTSRILPSLEDFTKVLSKKPLNSVLFFIYSCSSLSL